MPRIKITEHSDTYSYQTRPDSFGCVALPICAIWGPTYKKDDPDENPDWVRFSGGYNGTVSFVRTFRGANTLLGAREKSYDYALKLLASGYDVLVKRCDNFGKRSTGELLLHEDETAAKATGTITLAADHVLHPDDVEVSADITVTFRAKRTGTFYNNLRVRIERLTEPIAAEPYTGKVTCILYVYYETSAGRTLLEKTRFSYSQGAPTIQDPGTGNKLLTLWHADEIPINSSYIENLVIKGLGSGDTPYYREALNMSGGTDGTNSTVVTVRGKYPGSYGNQLKVRIKTDLDDLGRTIGLVEVFDRNKYYDNSNRIVPTDSLLEQVAVSFDEEAATDSRPMITEAVYNYLGYISITNIANTNAPTEYVVSLVDGTDRPEVVGSTQADMEGRVLASDITYDKIVDIAEERFDNQGCSFIQYLNTTLNGASQTERITAYMQQMCYQNAIAMIPELTDPILYDWDAVFCSIRDDQYVPKTFLDANPTFDMTFEVTKMHYVLIETAANSKCGAALIGTPFGMKRGTWEPINQIATGAILFKNELNAYVGKDYSTFGELVGPWCRATLPLSGINSWVCPEMAHLLLIISVEAKDGVRYWWLPPAGMVDTGVVYAPEYKIKKAYLNLIQNHDEGVNMNPLMHIPGKGLTCFGNSTLWDKPLGTYNALQNLSTRFLCNRVKQGIWNAAIEILFKYNNEEAYTHFYALLSPLLDLMRSVGALNSTPKNPMGYRIVMNPDIIGLDHINANTVIGKVELAVQGVIDDVDVDLFLLPPNYFEEEGSM